jgi:hypothetical protein
VTQQRRSEKVLGPEQTKWTIPAGKLFKETFKRVIINYGQQQGKERTRRREAAK